MAFDIHDTSKTKIIATIGPASSSESKLRELIVSGIDMCRLNFSHGSYDQHEEVIQSIRKLNKELGTHVAILADLQGPKIRLGTLKEEGSVVERGDKIVFTNSKVESTKEKVHISYDKLPADINVGDTILVDDGKLKFEVEETDGKSEITARTIHGGPLYSRKGVNLPDTEISIPSMTKKDIEDVQFILDHDLDWIALSFTRWASDIKSLKKIIKEQNRKAMVIAKIEKPEALAELNKIIKAADAVMVARGDLGVEVSFDKVPYIQKQIVQKCINKSTPVIIATQMLESMMTNFRPTRAEANDVANAVFDCADTVMLSGETSVGNYPVESIKNMQKIIDYAEETEFVLKHEHPPEVESKTYIPDSICYNATKLANQSGAKAIIAFAAMPKTAFRLASYRPKAPIYVFTSNLKMVNQLSIVWGVRAILLDEDIDATSAVKLSIEILKQKELIKTGDIVLHISSLPIFDKAGVNTMKLSYV